MGQKVHPKAIRIGVNLGWQSAWFAGKAKYADMVLQDVEIRNFLQEKLKSAGLEQVNVNRYASKLEIVISVARPGVVIGRAGSGIEAIRKELMRKYGKNIELKVLEVKNPESSAQLIGENIANQLERRIVPKFSASRALEAAKTDREVKGVRIWVSGRIKGAEIARTEKFQWGTVPLQTIRAGIDYAYVKIQVPNAGIHGIKVWVYKGEKFSYEVGN